MTRETPDPGSIRVPEALIRHLKLRQGDRVHLSLDGEGRLLVRDEAGRTLARVSPRDPSSHLTIEAEASA